MKLPPSLGVQLPSYLMKKIISLGNGTSVRIRVLKFTETCLVFARVISRRMCPEFCLLNLDEDSEIFVVPLLIDDRTFLIYMQLDAGSILTDSELIGQILNKRADFAKLMLLLQE